MTIETSVLATKLNTFVRLSDGESRCLAQLQSSSIEVARGAEFVHQGETGNVAYILQSGWACSSKLLPDGGRQVITFPIPGDCVGLRSILLRTADHSVAAVTDSIVSRIQISRILEVFNEFPHLATAILWATSRDEAMVVEHLASVGRRTAIERTAHFFLELYDQLTLIEMAQDGTFNCPLSQYELGDALGLSAIHVNRVLRMLREQGLMTFNAHTVTLHNIRGLKELAGYETPEHAAVLVR
ncbi:MAG: Crp/Fnr family transcriptional regulator [Hyphomicrobium sp.]|nr:Crp/Fnr family transcriptional regulator [Hyphomicrobium sp.]